MNNKKVYLLCHYNNENCNNITNASLADITNQVYSQRKKILILS